MSEKQSIILLCQGGMGDVLSSTSCLRSFRNVYPDDEIVVIATHAFLLEQNKNIDRLISFALDREIREIYNQYIYGKKKIRFFKHYFLYDQFFDTPGFESKTLPEYICKVYGVEYDEQPPDYTITPYEREAATEWKKQFEKPIIFLHLTGILPMKSIDFNIITPIIEKYHEKYAFVQIGGLNEPYIGGPVANGLGMPVRDNIACLPYAKANIFIESIFAHVSGALGLNSVVLFQSTSPDFFGYKNHFNVHNSGGCELWPCNRPIGSLHKFLPAFLNLSNGTPMPWMCPDPKCKSLTTEQVEEVFLEAIKAADEKEKQKAENGPFEDLTAARKSEKKSSKKAKET